MEKLLLTADEVAEVLGIGRTKVYELMAAGTIRSIKIGSCRRVTAVWLREYVERLSVDAA
jgi:excisionase family DNA binding protein